DITAAEILSVLQKIERQGLNDTAHRLRSTIGSVFRYAIATARAETDPTYALRGAISIRKAKSMAAIVNPEQFGGLLRAVWDYQGYPATI
ncbi:phage integrase central domain-containing protein, partial [Klebsiella aerogenes]|uniref:phage integrase central domain-containing protein n=1 Tax=Klebsiella aerogenes TaxID=548 RepID=UPI003F6660B9